MLNLKTDREIGVDHKFVTTGPVNGAVMFERVAVSIDPFEVHCLTRPSNGTSGLSMAFWINILKIYGNETLLHIHQRRENFPGVYFKVFTRGADKIFQISVITHHPNSKCMVQFKYKTSTWIHVAFTWHNGDVLNLFLNGIMQFSDVGLCIKNSGGTPPTLGYESPITPLILGSPNAVMLLDDVALWDRWLHVEEVYDIYYTLIEGKRTNCYPRTQDNVSLTYPTPPPPPPPLVRDSVGIYNQYT